MSATISIDGKETWPRPGYGAMGEPLPLSLLPLFPLFLSPLSFVILPFLSSLSLNASS